MTIFVGQRTRPDLNLTSMKQNFRAATYHNALCDFFLYWPAKERLQNIDAICFIVKTKKTRTLVPRGTNRSAGAIIAFK